MNNTFKKPAVEKNRFKWTIVKHSSAIFRHFARIYSKTYVDSPFWMLGIKTLYNLILNLVNYNPQKQIHINWYYVIPCTARLLFLFSILHKIGWHPITIQLIVMLGRTLSILAEQIIREGSLLVVFQNPFLSLTYLEFFNAFIIFLSVVLSENIPLSQLKPLQVVTVIKKSMQTVKLIVVNQAPLVAAFILFYILEAMQRAKMDKYYDEKYRTGTSIVIPFILSTGSIFLLWCTYHPKMINLSFTKLMQKGYVSVIWFIIKALGSVVPIFLIDRYGIDSAIADIDKYTHGQIRTRIQSLEQTDLFLHVGVNANNMFCYKFYRHNALHIFINTFYQVFTYALDYLILMYLS